MAFFLQYRDLCKRVKQQLDEFHDQEKGQQVQSPRLSGDTAQVRSDSENGPGKKGSQDDSEGQSADLKQWPYAAIDGISVQENKNGEQYYQVDWESAHDPQNPHNWSTRTRIRLILILDAIAFIATAASSIDAGTQAQAAKALGVSEVVEALGGTGIFLIGFGLGSLLSSPASEMVGRYPVYLGALSIFGCWLIGSALSPNIGAQIAFRFLAGLFVSAPLTVAGGSMSDMFNPKEKTWAFPMFAIVGFGGPVLGPVISSYFSVTGVLDWRWSEWIMLIGDGLVIALVLAFKRETLAPQLLSYKARHFRKLTGDDRFKAPVEAAGEGLGAILKKNFTRPFILGVEPIIIFMTLYLSIVYIILFTFLDGYTYIYEMTFGVNTGISNLCFLGLLVGILLSVVTVPPVWILTKKQLERDGDDGTGIKLNKETRLIYAMTGAPLIPIGLFIMAWTDYSRLSIWGPLVGSVVVGFGIIQIFTSTYMCKLAQCLDTFTNADASRYHRLVRDICRLSSLFRLAGSLPVCWWNVSNMLALPLLLLTPVRTVVGVPFYKNVGTHWTLSILACIAVLVIPIPYVLYKFGPKIRAKSKYAAKEDQE